MRVTSRPNNYKSAFIISLHKTIQKIYFVLQNYYNIESIYIHLVGKINRESSDLMKFTNYDFWVNARTHALHKQALWTTTLDTTLLPVVGAGPKHNQHIGPLEL